jgi:uncharacterized protein
MVRLEAAVTAAEGWFLGPCASSRPGRHLAGDGQYTLRDILSELQKPGRDPRASFSPPKFRDDVQKLEDLKLGMELEGVVTNVTAFGAFVDVGVHQDGLVHVSQLADRFVKNPSDVVKVGDKLNVRVLEIDLQHWRIALSARRDAATAATDRMSAAAVALGTFGGNTHESLNREPNALARLRCDQRLRR